MYADLTTESKSFLKRFSHGSRFNIALDLLNPGPEDKILDYGTGDGYILPMIRAANSHCEVVGYEPVQYMFEELKDKMRESGVQGLHLRNNLDGLTSTYNKICCLEVLEHLAEKAQMREIKKMMGLLSDNGQIIISVPIEVGLSSLMKNIVRILLRQTHDGTNFRNIVYSLFGVHFHRGEAPYIPSHVGFYYRDLEKLLLASGLRMRLKKFSPLPALNGVINSQVFFVLEKVG